MQKDRSNINFKKNNKHRSDKTKQSKGNKSFGDQQSSTKDKGPQNKNAQTKRTNNKYKNTYNTSGGPSSKQGENSKPAHSQVRIGQEITLTIRRLGINGEGVGYFKKQVVFVDGALPEEVVICTITDIAPKFATAKLKKIRTASSDRVLPPCPIYSSCGGCQLQHLSYEGQLKEKKDQVIQAFERYTSYTGETLPIKDTVGMEDPWGYRNKGQLQVGKVGDQVIAGLYKQGSHELIDLSECAVQHPKTNEVIQKTKEILQKLNIPVYNERKRTGVIRTIVTRIGFETGQLQLVLVTRTKEIPNLQELLLDLRFALPEVKSIVQNINSSKTSTIFGDETIMLWGEERIEEQLGDLAFSLSPRAFFQLNPIQTKKLYNKVKEYAQLSGSEIVVDAYCGVGTIGLWLADGAKEIRGMDVIPEAIEDARENALKSGVENALYEVGKAETWLPRWVKEGYAPDVIVVDPPRTGCDDQLLKAIIQVKPKRLVYVSCNPSTLAKDCKQLLAAGFELKEVTPYDMFPHTSHVESVILMERRGEPK
ncbi:23S rRNA (uracil(1939)-C(5))-methyltransferase RlmD [Bacillus horti]|uniref:23S rRNA (Uracil-5-)-methyltransferase RumA n=1 Tax=Caldalkalibacillus horti TaxID=77523 RepID=A0ABT9W178_9BACI|nr:23S rRNA (uracil(1939)-C(5))-methyltransferase RlmD [Bacillus horti]MDQ0166961.1 23S rRNA (uracil-5-)-methyltransferase RumA [Bacillus horti]